MPTYEELKYSYPDPELYDNFFEDTEFDLFDDAAVVDEFVNKFPSREAYMIYHENHDSIMAGIQGDHIEQLEEELSKFFPVYLSFFFSHDSLIDRFLVSVEFLKESHKFTNKYDPPYSLEQVSKFLSNFIDTKYVNYYHIKRTKEYLETM